VTNRDPYLRELRINGASPDSVAIFSGGMDSTTLVYHMLDDGYTPHLISFDYGQRHSKELLYAEGTAHKLGLRYDIVDLSGITHLISNSALTSPDDNAIAVPEGHYAQDNMKLTVVPNRNMIMLSIAAGVAVNNGYKYLATGVHAGDHFVYPDCRPEFIDCINDTIISGNEGFGPFAKLGENEWVEDFIYAPFIRWSKAEIAVRAIELGVPFEDTWSCYKGGETHCGKCGTCVERLEAIHQAQESLADSDGMVKQHDKTEYADTKFWQEAVASR
jgi:7-cyano-7-deazaguanine synthase